MPGYHTPRPPAENQLLIRPRKHESPGIYRPWGAEHFKQRHSQDILVLARLRRCLTGRLTVLSLGEPELALRIVHSLFGVDNGRSAEGDGDEDAECLEQVRAPVLKPARRGAKGCTSSAPCGYNGIQASD